MGLVLKLKPRAEDDLSDIWDYTESNWGLNKAEEYIGEIIKKLQTLCDEPYKGQNSDYIQKGYSKYFVGSHVAFYRVDNDSLIVVRILHQSMDVTQHLDSE